MQRHSLRWLGAILLLAALSGATGAQTEPVSDEIILIAGRSTVIKAPWPTVRVAVTDPKIADVQVLTPEQVLVQGLKVGSTDLILWSEDEQQTWQRRIVVAWTSRPSAAASRGSFPARARRERIRRDPARAGSAASADQAARLKDYLEKTKIPYVNMTSLAGVQQVQLQVRRRRGQPAGRRPWGSTPSATDDDFFFGQRSGPPAAALVAVHRHRRGRQSQQPQATACRFATPDGGIGAGPLITLFAGFPKANLEFFFQALAENQYMRILANPTLVALSGEEAHFLAGGEFPIPVLQGTSRGRSEPDDHHRVQGIRRAACRSVRSSSATAASACGPCRRSAS